MHYEGTAVLRFTQQGTGRTFDVTIDWSARRGRPVELLGYALRATDGHAIPPEVRREFERGLDGSLASAAYAQAMARAQLSEGLGTLSLTGTHGETVEVPARLVRRASDPEKAAQDHYAEAERIRRRRDITPELLEQVAAVYLSADPSRPTAEVRAAFNVSAPQASRYVRAAREAGLIPPREA
jgi:hypothetical protein